MLRLNTLTTVADAVAVAAVSSWAADHLAEAEAPVAVVAHVAADAASLFEACFLVFADELAG